MCEPETRNATCSDFEWWIVLPCFMIIPFCIDRCYEKTGGYQGAPQIPMYAHQQAVPAMTAIVSAQPAIRAETAGLMQQQNNDSSMTMDKSLEAHDV